MKIAQRQLLKKTLVIATAVAGLYASPGLLVTSQAAGVTFDSPSALFEPQAALCIFPDYAKAMPSICGGESL